MTDEQQIAEVRERFVREIATHELEVIRDDGLYKHLRFKRPDTGMYYFDLVTWPGYLAVVGDCGSFLFSRTRDMLDFFSQGHGFDHPRWGINPHYWGEKLQAPKGRESVKVYSERAFKARVLEWFDDQAEHGDLDNGEKQALRFAVNEQILDDMYGEVDEHEAHRRLRDFDHNGLHIGDSWEWSLREWDWQYLWCCWAIVWGIEQYRATAPEAVPA